MMPVKQEQQAPMVAPASPHDSRCVYIYGVGVGVLVCVFTFIHCRCGCECSHVALCLSFVSLALSHVVLLINGVACKPHKHSLSTSAVSTNTAGAPQHFQHNHSLSTSVLKMLGSSSCVCADCSGVLTQTEHLSSQHKHSWSSSAFSAQPQPEHLCAENAWELQLCLC